MKATARKPMAVALMATALAPVVSALARVPAYMTTLWEPADKTWGPGLAPVNMAWQAMQKGLDEM